MPQTPSVEAYAGAPGAADLRHSVQRRTVRVLLVSQALGGLGNTVGVVVAAILAEDVSGSESLAGLVQTVQVSGAAAASYLLARVSGTAGRRVGLAGGYLVGAAGAAVCVLGGALRLFPLLLLGSALLGFNSATNYQSRYAAADLADPDHRARALSVVLWASTIGAVAGPNLVGPAGRVAEAVALPPLVGPFLMSVVVVLIASGVLLAFLRPDPLLLAQRLAADSGGGRAARGGVEPGPGSVGAWALVRGIPAVRAAVVAMASAHAVMVAVMVMTPLHMDHGGAGLEVIGFVISIHVLGMFGFSPVFGWLADRLGRPALLATGVVLMTASLACSGTSPVGASPRIGVGLFMLGLGWSCCTVAASALLTEATPFRARTAVQGAADVVMSLAAAGAGLLAGVVVEIGGFGWLNAAAGVLVLGVLVSAVLAGRLAGRPPGDGDRTAGAQVASRANRSPENAHRAPAGKKLR